MPGPRRSQNIPKPCLGKKKGFTSRRRKPFRCKCRRQGSNLHSQLWEPGPQPSCGVLPSCWLGVEEHCYPSTYSDSVLPAWGANVGPMWPTLLHLCYILPAAVTTRKRPHRPGSPIPICSGSEGCPTAAEPSPLIPPVTYFWSASSLYGVLVSRMYSTVSAQPSQSGTFLEQGRT